MARGLLSGWQINQRLETEVTAIAATFPAESAPATARDANACSGQPREQRLSTGAFEDLVHRYQRELKRYAYRLSGNRHTAEDLVQDALVRAWRSLDGLQHPGAVKSWLYTIVRRENARRFERSAPQEGDLPPEGIAAQRRDYDTSTEAFVLRRAVRALPAEYREPLVLQVLHGLSQQEIADRLGLTSAGVGTRLFRARHKLREAVGALA